MRILRVSHNIGEYHLTEDETLIANFYYYSNGSLVYSEHFSCLSELKKLVYYIYLAGHWHSLDEDVKKLLEKYNLQPG